MTAALDAGQRTRLERIVTRGRRVLEHDLADQAAGRFGIDPDGTMADEDALRLDSTALTQRRELVEVIDHLTSEGDAPPAAVARLLRETTFTHLNRLVAIRIAEALGLLPPSLANGRSSQGFRDVLELAPLLAGDQTGGYWSYLKLCGDELAGDVPALFDPRNPLLVLAPSPAAVDEIVDLVAERDTESLWLAPDCLGWMYQFFNTSEERRAMRERSAAPGDSRELAVRNQFFTPRYVVDFLVQNSLGRRLMDADPTSPLLHDLPMLIDPPTQAGEPIDLAGISMLDPACGSGHFLLAGYDILERAWHHAGVDAAEAAPPIVRSLWGIDIDPRCAQVAAAALIFRARRSCRDGALPRPNVICARALPATSTGLEELLAALPEVHRCLVDEMTEALADAPILGPLLKIEERLETELRAAIFGGSGAPGTFGEALVGEDSSLEQELLAALGAVANATTASSAERLLAAEADDAIRFVQALQRRYDAVCMNPPFGDPVPEAKGYLKKGYPEAPGATPMEACFVLRGLELRRKGGYLGAITSRSGMFLSTFEKWRSASLLGGRLRALVDLGYGVMEQAMVEAAAYAVGDPQQTTPASFIRLLRDPDRADALRLVAERARVGEVDQRLHHAWHTDLEALPRKALAYWISPWTQRMFRELPDLESSVADVRVGGWPGDNFRLLRLWWEPSRRNPEPPSWVTYAKGGTYAPFHSDPHLLLAWDKDRRTFFGFFGRKGRETPVPENVSYYFRPGLTWSTRTASNLAVRTMPEGTVFGHKGPGIFADSEPDLLVLLSWLNSRYARAFVEAQVAAGEEVQSGSASRSYEAGLVQRIPWPGPRLSEVDTEALARNAALVISRLRDAESEEETSLRFERPFLLGDESGLDGVVQTRVKREEQRALDILEATGETDLILAGALGVGPDEERDLVDEVGPHPMAYKSADVQQLRVAVASLYEMPIDGLVDAVVAERQGGRYLSTMSQFADRRLELMAHYAQASPVDVVAERRRQGLLPPREPERTSRDVISYAVGLAFGRWKVGALTTQSDDRDPPTALFEVMPPFPPAMASRKPNEVGGYGQSGRELLVDEIGSPIDVEDTVLVAARNAFGEPDELILDSVRTLNRPSLRVYLRRDFFRDHLARYSKSRRKAPIYWPLYVPSGHWGVWIYAPNLTRETLFAVGRAAGDRLDQAEVEIRRLQRERDTGGAGRSIREVVNALESEGKLAEELRRFRDEAERIAGLGWDPDLDDGIILCAAPLRRLFPAWKDAASACKEIKTGKYPWATVSKWANQL